MAKDQTVIIPVGKYAYFAHQLHEALIGVCDVVVNESITQKFPDGETYSALGFDPRGLNIVIVGGTVDDEHTLAIYDIACAAAKYGAATITLVIPYFGYSTMERAKALLSARSKAKGPS